MNASDTDTLHIDLNRLGEWAVENAMKINLGKSKSCKLHDSLGDGSSKLFFGGLMNSGSKVLQIFRNSLM
jgi:hypothetical protein